MPRVILPGLLRDRTSDGGDVVVEAGTVGEVLRQLEARHPRLRGWILDESGGLRQHVKLFVNDSEASLDSRVETDDEMHVVPAISGGATAPRAEPARLAELLVGTRKGLFVLSGPRGGPMQVVARQFPGQDVEFAIRDPRTDICYASVTHGQFGPHLYFSDDPTSVWEQAEGPAFPEAAGASVNRTWVVEPGVEEGEMWAGVAPAALFRSSDGGRSWELNRALWGHPTRPNWEGGMGGLCLHSICTWPGKPDRLAVGISAAGVWLTEDGGRSWRRRTGTPLPAGGGAGGYAQPLRS